jgi:hypothetical protein
MAGPVSLHNSRLVGGGWKFQLAFIPCIVGIQTVATFGKSGDCVWRGTDCFECAANLRDGLGQTLVGSIAFCPSNVEQPIAGDKLATVCAQSGKDTGGSRLQPAAHCAARQDTRPRFKGNPGYLADFQCCFQSFSSGIHCRAVMRSLPIEGTTRVKIVFKFLILAIAVQVSTAGAPAIAQVPATGSPGNGPATATASTEAWHGDLVFLETKLLQMHPDLFRKTSRQQFDAEIRGLDQNLPSMSREQFLVGIMRIVASFHDGHTSVLPGPQTGAGFHVLPLRFYLYGEELVLDGADQAYSEVLGSRLVAVNGVPVTDVIRRVRELTPGDNEACVDARLPGYIIVPEVLEGLQIVNGNASTVPLTFQNGETVKTFTVNAIPAPDTTNARSMTSTYGSHWIDRAPQHRPVWLRSPDRSYWFEYEPKERTIYVQYNNSENDPAEPMQKFALRLEQELVRRNPPKVIVDLRLNQGGSGDWNRPLLAALMRSSAATAAGHMYVLIGRQTFSAGNMMAIELEKYTKAKFIGEPSGGSFQGFGDHEPVFLPATHLGVMIAKTFYQNDGPTDDRSALSPSIKISLGATDYGIGRDPVLEAALHDRELR